MNLNPDLRSSTQHQAPRNPEQYRSRDCVFGRPPDLFLTGSPDSTYPELHLGGEHLLRGWQVEGSRRGDRADPEEWAGWLPGRRGTQQ